MNDENPMLLKAFDAERAAHGVTADRLAVAEMELAGHVAVKQEWAQIMDFVLEMRTLRAECERLRAYCGVQIARSAFATADDMRAALDRERAAHTATATALWEMAAERDVTAPASNSV